MTEKNDMTRRGFLGSLVVLGGAGLVPIKLGEKPPKKIKITPDQIPGWDGESIKIRPVEVAYMDGGAIQWHRTRFSFIRTGDIFRLLDRDGTLSNKGAAYETCIAVDDPIPIPLSEDRKHWTWSVRADPYSVLTIMPEDEAHLTLVGEGLLHPDNMDADRIGADPFAARWKALPLDLPPEDHYMDYMDEGVGDV